VPISKSQVTGIFRRPSKRLRLESLRVRLAPVSTGKRPPPEDLSAARECIRIVRGEGPGKAQRLAEFCAATVLAGEIPIARAHHDLRRRPSA